MCWIRLPNCSLNRYKDWLEEEEIETPENKWDELFAKPKAKRVMREMAREAREDYRAGRTTDIEITEDGRLELVGIGSAATTNTSVC